jgi:hypothetical protein
MKSWIRSSNVVWKFSIGMKGIMVKKKIREGNIARKKLKDIADALDVMYPSYSPLMKKPATLYKGSPSKPGKTIFFDALMIKAITFL